MNVSRSGVGLVAAGAPAVGEGEKLSLTFQLPGSGVEVQASGVVMWIAERPSRVGGGRETALGVSFREVVEQVALERYLLDHLAHVVVATASPKVAHDVREALEDKHCLHFADNEAELWEMVGRGDIAAVVLFGDDCPADRIERMFERQFKDASLIPADLLPAVIVCSRGASEEIVGLFNSGSVFRALPADPEMDELTLAVQAACNAYGERTEQRRTAQALERALARQRAGERSTAELARSAGQSLVARSGAMERVLELVTRAAPHRVSVLLQGETGTGKEVLAHLIHELSPRTASSFVIQDCGVLTETLLESELFGHVKGAFTGAVTNKPGLFVMADGGTVFLDEIENTTPGLQAKLLRVIETGTVRPVGGTRVHHVDVRVVAASNRDLQAEVAAGRFRADLFYRLNSFPVRVPPLRERRADILPLADHFLRQANERFGASVHGLTEDAARTLESQDWPGNIRELRNVIECAVLLGEPGKPLARGLLPAWDEVTGAPVSLKDQVRGFERELIARALRENDGVFRRAAACLHMSPVTLRRKAIDYGLAGDID